MNVNFFVPEDDGLCCGFVLEFPSTLENGVTWYAPNPVKPEPLYHWEEFAVDELIHFLPDEFPVFPDEYAAKVVLEGMHFAATQGFGAEFCVGLFGSYMRMFQGQFAPKSAIERA